MLILGMESSCDETSAAVVEMSEGVRKIRSNIVLVTKVSGIPS